MGEAVASRAATPPVGGKGDSQDSAGGPPLEWIPHGHFSDVSQPYKNKQHATPHSHLIFLPGSAYFLEGNKKNKAENQPSGYSHPPHVSDVS